MRTPRKHSRMLDEVFLLDADEFDRRIGESYASFYLTLVGLIQGIAIIYLVSSAFGVESLKALADGGEFVAPTTADVPMLLRFLLSFIAIIIVTHEYAVIVVLFKRYPSYLDIIFLILIGISQTTSIFFIKNDMMWWLFNGVFCMLSVVAYQLTLNARPLNFKRNTTAFKRSGRYLVSFFILLVAAMIVCFIASYSAYNSNITFAVQAAPYGAYGVLGIVMMLMGWRFNKSLRVDLIADSQKE